MPDGTTSIAKAAWEIVRYPVILLVGLLGWNLKRQISRMDNMEKDYVGRKEFNETLTSLRTDTQAGRDDIKNGFDGMREDIRDITKRIDRMNDKGNP